MKFHIQSAKTKQFLYEAVQMPNQKPTDRALWTNEVNCAKVFLNPSDANQTSMRLSTSTRARIVLWDGNTLWNVTESKNGI
jgi:hypothetical protein